MPEAYALILFNYFKKPTNKKAT